MLSLVADSVRSGFREALVDAGSNWDELAQAVVQIEPEFRDEAVWLIREMPHLDRLEMTGAILLEHIRYAHQSLTAFRYSVPESLFRDYILSYRIANEPVTAWRRLLFDRFAAMTAKAATPEQAARIANRWLARNVRFSPLVGFFGPMKAPELTMASGYGSREEIAVLAAAIFKALGIPSRRVRVPWLGEENGDASWVEVFSDGRWLPVYPLDAPGFGDPGRAERRHPQNVTIAVASSAFSETLVTEQYTPHALISLHLTSAGVPLARYEHFSFNVFNSGAWRALDELNTVTDSSGNYRCVLGDGSYLLVCGLRDPRGNPWIVDTLIQVRPGESLDIALDLTPPQTRVPLSLFDDPFLQTDYPSLNGGISSAHSLKGKIGLVLGFFPQDTAAASAAVWLDSLYRANKDKGLAVLAVGSEQPAAVRAFQDRYGLSFDIAFSPSFGAMPGSGSVPSAASLRLLDRDSKTLLCERTPGASRRAEIAKQVADLLSTRPK